MQADINKKIRNFFIGMIVLTKMIFSATKLDKILLDKLLKHINIRFFARLFVF